jgi:DNA-binding NarL/FixJ family response regulator
MKTIEQIAAEVVERFREQYEKGPQFFAGIVEQSIRASIAREVEAEASLIIQKKYNPDIQGLMDRAINRWIELGEIDIKAPSKALRDYAEQQIHGIKKNEVAAATNRKMQHIYASRENGESFKSIAERLYINESTARAIYDNACKRLAALKNEISQYQE